MYPQKPVYEEFPEAPRDQDRPSGIFDIPRGSSEIDVGTGSGPQENMMPPTSNDGRALLRFGYLDDPLFARSASGPRHELPFATASAIPSTRPDRSAPGAQAANAPTHELRSEQPEPSGLAETGQSEQTAHHAKKLNGHRTTTQDTPRHTSSLATTLNLGRQLHELLAVECPGYWRSRGPKPTSFRKLAQRFQSSLSPSTMWRAVAIYELSLHYPELNRYQHLGIGHMSELLRVKGSLQIELMRTAEHHLWTRRRLKDEVKTALKTASPTEPATSER